MLGMCCAATTAVCVYIQSIAQHLVSDTDVWCLHFVVMLLVLNMDAWREAQQLALLHSAPGLLMAPGTTSTTADCICSTDIPEQSCQPEGQPVSGRCAAAMLFLPARCQLHICWSARHAEQALHSCVYACHELKQASLVVLS